MDKVTPRSSGDPSRQTTGSETHSSLAAFGRRSIPAKQPVMKPAIHPGQTAGGGTHAAFGQRSIPAKQPVVEPTRRSAGDPSRLNRVAARRSSLRFGRNTPGIPPSRALSAGRLAPTGRTGRPRRSRGFHHRLFTASLRAAHRCVSVEIHQVFLPHAPCQPDPHRENWASPPPGELAGLGAHAGSTTGCSPRRCAPLIVAFRSEYTRYSSLTRLVSRAPRPHRENWPLSALTRVPPPAVNRPGSASFCPGVIRRTDRRCRVPASAGPRAFG